MQGRRPTPWHPALPWAASCSQPASRLGRDYPFLSPARDSPRPAQPHCALPTQHLLVRRSGLKILPYRKDSINLKQQFWEILKVCLLVKPPSSKTEGLTMTTWVQILLWVYFLKFQVQPASLGNLVLTEHQDFIVFVFQKNPSKKEHKRKTEDRKIIRTLPALWKCLALGLLFIWSMCHKTNKNLVSFQRR